MTEPTDDKADKAIKAQNGAKVGYGKPPKDTQFKKGQSGNPKGRPKQQSPPDSLFDVSALMAERCCKLKNGKLVSAREAMLLGLMSSAIRGNASAIIEMLGYRCRALKRFLHAAAKSAIAEKTKAAVFLLPAIEPIDSWQAIAIEHQAKLMREIRD